MSARRWLALVSLGVVACTGCDRPGSQPASAVEPDGAQAIAVTVAPVTVQPSARVVNFVGTLYGNEEVTLSSQVEGQIKALSVDLGDAVQAGQVVAQIDDDQLQTRLREAEATLAKAQADEARGRQLVSRQIISVQEYESMKTRVDVAQAQRDTLTVTVRHTRVVSPLTGAVARRFVSVGEYVRAGSQLFGLVAEDPVKLRGDVPERFAHELQVGQLVQVRIDAFPDQVFPGRLARISPASNPQNRSVAVEVLVDNPERRLKPGFYANAGVVTRTDDRAVMVPQDALITFAGVTKVFVVQDGVARQREVRTGSRGTSGLVEITSGLEANERVATSGLNRLGDGTAVTVRDAGGAARAPTP